MLFLLDEFDKIQEGIDTGVTSPQVPENLRSLFHNYSEVTAILSYSKLLKRLRNEYWSMLFGLGYPVTVGPLSEENARILVTLPAENKLIYTDQARDKIIYLCARQPFLIQQMCNCIFDLAAETSQHIITESMVDQVAQLRSSENEHFRTLWNDYVGAERRKYILVLCEQLEHGPDPITSKLLEIKLADTALISSKKFTRLLSDDLAHLKDLDLITMEDGGKRYSLTVPLMALWIRHNIDYEEQKRKTLLESEERV